MAVRDPEVQDMLDEFALRKLVHAYCRAVDRGDLALLRTLYHPDASDAHGALTGSSPGSVTEFLDQLAAMRPYVRSMQHNITTVNFAVDGDVAEGEIYTIATHTVVRRCGGRGRRGRWPLPRQISEARGHMGIHRAHDRHRLGPCDGSVCGRPEPPDHQGIAGRRPRRR